MDIPCRLYRLRDGSIAEAIPAGQSGSLIVPAGHTLPEAIARQLGVAQYLEGRAARKAVSQAEAEDKAVHQDDVEDKARPQPTPSPGAAEGPESRRRRS